MSRARVVMWRPEHLKGWEGQVCKACGRVDVVHYKVPDKLWEFVVPEELRTMVVCLRCFDAFAARKRIDYADQLEDIGFAGMRESFGLRVTTEYTVTLTELEAQIEEVARRRLDLSAAEVEERIDSGEWEKDEDNYELWSWLRGMVGSARAMRKRVQSVCTCG